MFVIFVIYYFTFYFHNADNGGLKLHKFAEINVLKENATLEYLARENRSTVWPGKLTVAVLSFILTILAKF